MFKKRREKARLREEQKIAKIENKLQGYSNKRLLWVMVSRVVVATLGLAGVVLLWRWMDAILLR